MTSKDKDANPGKEVGRKRLAIFRKQLGDLWWEHGEPKKR